MSRPAQASGQATPGIGPGALLHALWREKWAVLAGFALPFALGAWLAFTASVTYQSEARLLVMPNSAKGESGIPELSLMSPEPTKRTLRAADTEAELLGSDTLKETTLRDLSIRQVYPKIASKGDGRPEDVVMGKAIQRFRTGLSVSRGDNTGMITVSFSHADPETSAGVLETLVQSYLKSRKDVFRAPATLESFEREKRRLRSKLETIRDRLGDLRRRYEVSDPESELDLAVRKLEEARARKENAESELAGSEAKIASLERQLSNIPERIVLSSQTENPKAKKTLLKIAEVRSQIAEKSAVYEPDSKTVSDLKSRLSDLRDALRSYKDARVETAVRKGPNPVRERIEGELAEARATARSMESKLTSLDKIVESHSNRVSRLVRVRDKFDELLLREKTLTETYKEVSLKLEQDEIVSRTTEDSAPTVRVVERPRVPVSGSSAAVPIFAASFVLAAFSALLAGVASRFSRDDLRDAADVQRAVGLPVVAVVRRERLHD